ncbi:hypothetical protein AAFF_G00170280 [Aldrovandia affinis]|uniref:Uncharacterized protein n=1 Tax=Aldrovandia affinis TaxID=143900 RepID=A0AAD7RLD0_9TELE|nr:hypothetical protein AAFF_G00170280 [Aldrovandia affinis]
MRRALDIDNQLGHLLARQAHLEEQQKRMPEEEEEQIVLEETCDTPMKAREVHSSRAEQDMEGQGGNVSTRRPTRGGVWLPVSLEIHDRVLEKDRERWPPPTNSCPFIREIELNSQVHGTRPLGTLQLCWMLTP